MISPGEEQLILQRAYVPEHIVSLMTTISKGKALLIDDHLVYVKDNWVIVVGYPLDGNFFGDRLKGLARQVRDQYSPKYLWIIAPDITNDIFETLPQKEIDDYYRLDLADLHVKGGLKRVVKKAQSNLVVQETAEFTKEHGVLIREFIRNEKPGAMIRELYLSMAEYVNASATAFVLEARSPAGHLSAFFVIDTAAEKFDVYVVGCRSKKHHVPYASDLLFSRMIFLAQERKKTCINLGLGVNDGIRKFKEKWGGKAFLKYVACEYDFGREPAFSLFDSLALKP